MSETKALLLTCGFLCIYPILGWALINFVISRFRVIDWTNIRLPWRKS